MKEAVIVLSVINVLLLAALIIAVVLLLKYRKSNETIIEIENEDETNTQQLQSTEVIDEAVEVNAKKKTFDSDTIDFSLVEVLEEPIEMNVFVTNVNKLINKKEYKSITSTKIVNWLVSKGYVSEQKVQVVKEVTKYCVTSEGESIGIVSNSVVDKNTGEVSPSYLLSDKAQKYLLDELVNIYSKPKKKSKTNTTRVNSGTKWSPEEDQQLLDEYLNQKLKISEIAKIHGRKSGGIRARLKKKHGIEV